MSPSENAAILVVEDEHIVALDLRLTLRDLGYDPYAIAASADDALARAAERRPDLVLMDIRLQGERDGVEATRLFRDVHDVPVVFLTAHADERTLERAQGVEPHGYIVKPFRAADLRASIEIALFRHRTEALVRHRERWFSTTLSSIADAVVAVDLSGAISFLNVAAERLLGVAREEVMGRPARDIIRLDDGEAPIDLPLLRALREHRVVELAEAGLVDRRTGVRRVIADSASPVVERDEVLGAVMVFRDVTEQRLVAQRIELADRLTSLGTLSAGIAHEINNPLAALRTNVEFALLQIRRWEEEAIDPTGHASVVEALRDVESASRRIAGIVSDLRMFARPRDGAQEGSSDLREAVEFALRTTGHELRSRARIEQRLEGTPKVRGDPTRIGQVFVNLLMNAAQAIPPGRPDDHLVVVEGEVGAEGRARVRIRDSGGGMSEGVRRRMFEPFFTTKPVGLGSGLGLSIVHAILDSLGGTIAVESTLGRGTTVEVSLPIAVEEATARESTPTPTPSMRIRVLVVDEDALVREACRRALAPHTVTALATRAEALEAIERGRVFDVVIVELPVGAGAQAFERDLLGDPEQAARCILMTSSAFAAPVRNEPSSPPRRTLPKPFSRRELLTAVGEVFAERGPAGPLS